MKLNRYLYILFILIIIDLRIELKILIDHFTFSSLYFAFLRHPLAFFMLLSIPLLNKRLKISK